MIDGTLSKFSLEELKSSFVTRSIVKIILIHGLILE
jgi:hypothetical protein